MILDPYIRKMRSLVRIIDGDTVIAEVDLGYRTYGHHHFRLLRVNTPEMNSKDSAERAQAVEAKWLVSEWFEAHTHATVFIRSEKADSFGRYLGEFTCECGSNLNEELIAKGWGAS